MATDIRARYASAVASGSLTLKSSRHSADGASTIIDNPVIVGGYGIAGRDLERGHDTRGRSFQPAPLAVPLERLFAGDSNVVHEIVRIMAEMAFEESRRTRVDLSRTQAQDIAKAVLAWFRHGVCQPCGGRGKPIIKDTPVQSAHNCEHCGGEGKMPFERQFRYEWKPLARWLKERVEAESARAAPHAMRAIAGKMDL